jgi:internalin A
MRYVLFVLLLLVLLPVALAQDKEAEKPFRAIEKKTKAAWREAGAEVGWMRADKFGELQFLPENKDMAGDLPAFKFSTWKDGLLAKLPAPAAAFGLDLYMGGFYVTDAAMKELAGLKNLQILNLDSTSVTGAGLKELAGLKNLKTLNLAETKVTDAGLKELAGLKSLQTLNLYKTSVTGAGLKELAGLKNLQTLNLGLIRVTDTGLKGLAELKNLQTLSLFVNPVTDAGLKELAGLKNLQTLDLRGTNVTGVGLTELAGLKNLHTLDLEGIQVTDVSLKGLAGLKSLRTLNIAATEVTDVGLKELTGLKDLQSLGLGGFKVTDAGLKELAGLKSLHTLTVGGTQVTDVGLKELAGLNNLQSLDLANTKVTDAGLQHLAGLKSLQTLNLHGTQVTDAGLKHLAGLKTLQSLNLIATQVTEAGLKELAGLKLKTMTIPFALTDLNLKDYVTAMEPTTLDLRSAKVTDAGLKELAGLKLKRLSISPALMTDLGLKHYLAAIATPTMLDLRGTKVTDAGLRELAGLRSLQHLDLGGADVTDAGVEKLQKALPGCNITPAYVNEAEKLFRAMEKKIKAANAVQVAVDIELRAIKGREKETQLKDKVSKANGFLLLTKDNKVRLNISGEYVGMEMVSNGKQLKLWGEEQSIDEAKAMPTTSLLHGLLSMLVSRAGVTAGSIVIRFAPGPQFTPVFLTAGDGDPKDFDPEKLGWGIWDFKAGAAEKVGGRDAKVISYIWGPKDGPRAERFTLWIDAKTLLPLKQVIIIQKENLHITEIFTEFKLGPKINAKAFELIPAQGNEAEKLFRAVEEKIKAAKAVQFTFDIEMKGKDKQAKSNGSLLFTKDNKARLKTIGNESGKDVTIEMISDGKRMKSAESPETIANAQEEPTQTNLHSLLSTMVCGPGLLLTYEELSPGLVPLRFRLVYFNARAAEKVGGRDAKVVSYNAILRGATAQITLWIDAETLLPLKRVIVVEGNEKVEAIRITEICNFNVNPKIEAGAFALPK